MIAADVSALLERFRLKPATESKFKYIQVNSSLSGPHQHGSLSMPFDVRLATSVLAEVFGAPTATIPVSAAQVSTLKFTDADFKEAARFIERLTGESYETARCWFQTFDDNLARKDKSLASATLGTLKEVWPKIQRLQRRGAGAYITVNPSNGGRKGTDATGIRCVYRDVDTGTAPDLPLAEHMRVVTPGGFHSYLLVNVGTEVFQEWSAVMQRMVAEYGADKKAVDLTRVLRLPGTWHLKDASNPRKIRIDVTTERAPYTWAEIVAAIPPLYDTPSAPSKPSSRAAPAERALERAIALNEVTDKTMHELSVALSVIPADERDVWVNIGHAMASLKGTEFEAQAHDLWLDWSMKSDTFNDGDEKQWDTFKPSSITYKSVFAAADSIDKGWRAVAAPKKTVKEVIDTLRRSKSDEVLASWVGLVMPLSKSEAQEVIADVSRITGRGVRPLTADLADARDAAARAAVERDISKRVGDRLRIQWHPEDKTTTTHTLEAEIVRRARPGEYISFGGRLARVKVKKLPFTHLIDDVDGDPPEVPQIDPLDTVGALAMAERVSVFMQWAGDGWRPIGVPQGVIDILINKVDHAAPTVTGLVTHPIVLRDGTILSSDGLHQRSGLYLQGVGGIELRAYAQSEATDALSRLMEHFLQGFEFASQLDADIALAGLFTGVQRRVLDTAPGLMIQASAQSSGKTTLARRIHLILTGRDMPVCTFPEDEAEMGKRLLSMLLRSPALVCFDNLMDGLTFRSAALSSVMTGTELSQRILGESRDAEALTNVLFIATGNNNGMGADEVTRWMTTKLAPATARPQERSFKHADVTAHALGIRHQVLRDVVGIVAGCRGAAFTSNGVATRFPSWAKLVRDPLLWAGAADVAQVFADNNEKSPELRAHGALMYCLYRVFGNDRFRAGEVVAVAKVRIDSLATSPAELKLAAVGTVDEANELSENIVEALQALRVKDTRNAGAVGRALRAKLGRSVRIDLGGVDGDVVLAERSVNGTDYYKIEVQG